METMSAVQSGSSSALSVSALVSDHSDINTTVHLGRTISVCVCVCVLFACRYITDDGGEFGDRDEKWPS